MKIVAVIPYWDQYKYDDGLNNLDKSKLGGRILLNYPIILANKIKLIANTYLFTNDQTISQLLDGRLRFNVIERDHQLDNDQTSIEDVLRSFLSKVDADMVVMMHPRSPFIRQESVEECINRVRDENYDSAFLGQVEKKFAWYRGERINYDTQNGTPHLLGIEPVVLENSSLYLFTRKSFEKTGTRVGQKPFIKVVGSFEGMTISSAEEFELAEYLLDSQFRINE